MRRLWLVAVLAAFPNIGSAALDDQSILWVAWITPQPGMELAFEAALKDHHEWRRENNDTWRWLTWRIGSGERTGTYAVGSFNHRWQDLESPPVPMAAALRHFQETVAPYVQWVVVHHYSYQLSITHIPEHLPPRNFSITDEFAILPGREAQFLEAARQINVAIVEQGVQHYHEWYRLETGGTLPMYARVRLLWDWRDLDVGEREIADAVEKQFGRRKAARILSDFRESVLSRSNRYAQLRPDLFYIPGP